MEAAVVGALVNNILSKLGEVLLKMGEHSSSLEGDIQEMTDELGMIGAKMEDHLSVKVPILAVQRESMKIMRRLAFDIEDCLDRFLPCVECEGELSDRMNFVHKIQKLKNRVKAVHGQMADSGVKGSQQDSNNAGVDQADRKDIIGIHVGIDKPKEVLQELLLSTRQKLVISVVGFGGSGKSALARAVYDCDEITDAFRCRAWVVASKHKVDIKGLLTAILQQLLPDVAPTELEKRQAPLLQGLIKDRLRSEGTRCLIVIDDYEKHEWKEIMDFFSVLTIRIVVTTTLQSVAKACSSSDGYVYNMKTLSAEDSKIILKDMVSFFRNSQPALDDASDAILHKCDGHPLALISVANHLKDKKNLTRQFCQYTSRLLGLRMEENKNSNFTKLRQVLMNTYCSLPGSLRTCLLYTSLFPNDRPVSRQTLTCRWLAEGYIECEGPQSGLEAADDQFEELIDRNIIKSIEESNNGKAKTCKAHSIMHQFIQHRSTSSNFIATSFGAKNKSNFRHLVIENHRNVTASSIDHGSDPAANSRSKLRNLVNPLMKKVANVFKKSVSKKLRPRSLTIFGRAGEAVYSDLTNMQLLRVLDLKECSDFQDEHLEKIYELMHLKYLSLGRSVRDLSDDRMKRLHRLETLDLRKTMIETLPLEIIILPHLAHLFGKVKLNKLSKKLEKSLVENSKLHTLAGVVIDNNSGFPELMEDMKQLKKLKIWCETTSTDSNYTKLSKAIQKFAQAGIDTLEGTRLSLHLNDSSKDLLCHYQDSNTNATSTELIKIGYLSSLKLRGRPSHFEFGNFMCGLEELCLTYTKLEECDLLKLATLKELVFLKLVEVRLAILQINLGDFPRLQRLCLVVQEPGFPSIQKANSPSPLVSLQLLCEKLTARLSDHIEVDSFGCLQDIVLDSMVKKKTIQHWKNKARKHPSRPSVLFLKRIDPADTGSVVKYVATDPVYMEPPTLCSCGEICSHTDQGSLEPTMLCDCGEICSHTDHESLEPPMLCECSEICNHTDQGSLEPPMQGTA